MENNKDILSALEELSEKRPATIPELLEEFLRHVAQTGKTIFSWKLMKPLLVAKTEEVLDTCKKFKKDKIPHYSNMENVLFDRHRTLIMESLHRLDGGVCELLLNPRKNYKRADKYVRALFKNVSVASIIDPDGKDHVPLLQWKCVRGKMVCTEQGTTTGSSSADPSSSSAASVSANTTTQTAEASNSEQLAATAVSEGSAVTSPASDRRERLKRKRNLAIKVARDMWSELEAEPAAATSPLVVAKKARTTMWINNLKKSDVQEACDEVDMMEEDEEEEEDPEFRFYDSDKENSTVIYTGMGKIRERRPSRDTPLNLIIEKAASSQHADGSKTDAASESKAGEFGEDVEAECLASTSWRSDSTDSAGEDSDDSPPLSDGGSPERTSPRTPPSLSSRALSLSLGYSPLSPISSPPSPKSAARNAPSNPRFSGTKITRLRLWSSPVKSTAPAPPRFSETAAAAIPLDLSKTSLSHPSKPETSQTTFGTSARGSGESVESSEAVPGECSALSGSAVPSATPSPKTNTLSSVPSSAAEGEKESVSKEDERGENRTDDDVAGPTKTGDSEASSTGNTDEKSDLSVLKESEQVEAGDVGVPMEQSASESPDGTDKTVPEEVETGDLNDGSESENPTKTGDNEASSTENTDTDEKSDSTVIKESEQVEAGGVGLPMEQSASESPNGTDNTVPEEGETGDLNAGSESENPEQQSGRDEPGPEPMEED